MKNTKQMGIWMDHSIAHIIKLRNGKIITLTIDSQPEALEDDQKVYKDESHSLNKEKRRLLAYFKILGDIVFENEEVVLFGPTEAKNELLNHLREDHLFDKIKIDVFPADKMIDSQRSKFVIDHFK
ncbi:MAG: hypothetical protein WCP85_19375 [Mariniphaga sp.]